MIVLKLSLILFAGLLVSPAYAQINPDANADGINPDDFLWGLDLFIDDLFLAIQFNNLEKAKLGIKIAEERLAEVKIMIEERDLVNAERALAEHNKFLSVTQIAVGDIESEDNIQEIREKIEVEQRLEIHKTKIERVTENLQIEIEIRGDVTPEQQQMIDAILSSLEGKVAEVEIKIDNEKDETKIEIRIETGRSDFDIDEDIEDIQDEFRLPVIEVEIKNGMAEIEIERNGEEIEFMLPTTDLDEIRDEIRKRFNIPEETIAEVLSLVS